MSIETISAQFDVSMGTVHKIIPEELKMRMICVKFVPRYVTVLDYCHRFSSDVSCSPLSLTLVPVVRLHK